MSSTLNFICDGHRTKSIVPNCASIIYHLSIFLFACPFNKKAWQAILGHAFPFPCFFTWQTASIAIACDIGHSDRDLLHGSAAGRPRKFQSTGTGTGTSWLVVWSFLPPMMMMMMMTIGESLRLEDITSTSLGNIILAAEGQKFKFWSKTSITYFNKFKRKGGKGQFVFVSPWSFPQVQYPWHLRADEVQTVMVDGLFKLYTLIIVCISIIWTCFYALHYMMTWHHHKSFRKQWVQWQCKKF